MDKAELAKFNKGKYYAMKFPDDKSRQKLFEDLLEHLEYGLSQHCFVPCDWQTVEDYIVKFPNIFDTQRIEEAAQKGMAKLERIGIDNLHLSGSAKFNAVAWIFIMKNKYPGIWRDKTEVDTNVKHEKIEIRIIAPTPTPKEGVDGKGGK